MRLQAGTSPCCAAASYLHEGRTLALGWAQANFKVQKLKLGPKVKNLGTEIGSRQGQNLALTGLFVPSSLDTG